MYQFETQFKKILLLVLLIGLTSCNQFQPAKTLTQKTSAEITPLDPPPTPEDPTPTPDSPIPNDPTPTAPPAASCGPNEIYMGSLDLTWGMHAVQLWPIPASLGTGSGDMGQAIQFVANSVQYPRGVELGFVDESQPGKGKDYVINECPHRFTPVGNNPLCKAEGIGSYGMLYLRYGPAEERQSFGLTLPTVDCPLTPGKTYYINYREYKAAGDTSSRDTVHSQFVVYERTD